MTRSLPAWAREVAKRLAAEPPPLTPHELRAEAAALRADMLKHVTRRPRSAARLFDLVRQEWGELGERRLWRTLQWLMARGDITRVSKTDGYIRGQVSA